MRAGEWVRAPAQEIDYTAPDRCSSVSAPHPGSSGIQKVAIRNVRTAATAVGLAIPADVSPAMSVASTKPTPPGVGAIDDTIEPTR